MNELRAIVVDDEPLARDELTFLLGECGDVRVVGHAEDAPSALSLCAEHEADVVFVDLRMPGPDGIALAEALRRRHPHVCIVVVSAHDDGAVRAFETNVTDYLLKPVRVERLEAALARVRSHVADARVDGRQLSRIAVRRGARYEVIDVADVVYFEVRDELVWAITDADRYGLDMTLAALEHRLPHGAFFRSHRAVLVRLDRIRAIEPTGLGGHQLRLEHPGKPTVPLSRERTRALKALIPIAG
jgi:DNA-binding LytR/AlgR family response regulator